MKKTKIILIVILFGVISLCVSSFGLAKNAPWVHVVTGKVISVDEKNNALTIEFKKKEGFLKRTESVKLRLNVWTTYKPTEILINNRKGSLHEIKEGDIIKVTYEVTASAGNVAYRIEVINP